MPQPRSSESDSVVMKRPSGGQPWPIPADLRCSPTSAVLEVLNKPQLSKRQRDQEAGFVHMERTHMLRAHKESIAQETLAQLQGQASASASGQASAPAGSAAGSAFAGSAAGSASAGPSPAKFAVGQSVLHWWSGWMQEAKEPPKQLKGKKRPAWFDATIISAVGIKTMKYAGVVHENMHCYQVR